MEKHTNKPKTSVNKKKTDANKNKASVNKTVVNKTTTNKKKTKKSIKGKNIIILLVIIILFFIILRVINNNKIKVPDELSLIIDNQNITYSLENNIVIYENTVYISMEDVQRNLDSTIYLEEDTNYIITTSDKKVAKLELDNSEIEINGANVEINGQAFKTEEGTIYIPISELGNVYDMDFSYIKESKNITIDYYANELIKAYAKKNISIKKEKSGSSDTIAKVKKGDWVIYIEEDDGWAKIRTQSGYLGYVKKSKLTNFVTERENMQYNFSNAEKFLEKDITKENISKYDDRKELINKILGEAVTGEYMVVKIIYDKDTSSKEFDRFKIESAPVLKECGISIEF